MRLTVLKHIILLFFLKEIINFSDMHLSRPMSRAGKGLAVELECSPRGFGKYEKINVISSDDTLGNVDGVIYPFAAKILVLREVHINFASTAGLVSVNLLCGIDGSNWSGNLCGIDGSNWSGNLCGIDASTRIVGLISDVQFIFNGKKIFFSSSGIVYGAAEGLESDPYVFGEL